MPEDGAPSARDASRSDAHDRILDAAEELFGARGFDAVSVSEIATAAGVSTALIYYHFTDKESLLQNLLVRAAAVFEPLAGILDDDTLPARQRLADYVDTWITTVLEHDNLVRIMIYPAVDQDSMLSTEILGRVGGIIEALARAIAAGIERGEFAPTDPALAAECLFALLHTRAAANVLVAEHAEQSPTDPHEIARFIIDVFLGGLAIGAPNSTEGEADAC